MKKTGKKLLCLVLCVCTLAVMCVPAFAATYSKYTVLGDSFAAGYGLPDYEAKAKALGQKLNDGGAAWKDGSGNPGRIYIQKSYSQLVADALGMGSSYGKATYSGWRTTEFLKVLQGSNSFSTKYNEFVGAANWIKQDYFFTSLTEIDQNDGGLYKGRTVAAEQKAIMAELKNSDLITVNLGQNDIFSYALACVLFDEIPAIESAATNPLKLPTAIANFTTAFLNGIDHGTNNFQQDFPSLIEEIKKNVKSSAKIVVLGISNPLYADNILSASFIDLADLRVAKVNSWLKSYCDQNGLIYCDTTDTRNYGLGVVEWSKVFAGNFTGGDGAMWSALKAVHPTENGHYYIAQQILDVLGKGTANVTPTVTKVLGKPQLKWNAVKGAWGYEVLRSKDGGKSYQTVGVSLNTTYIDLLGSTAYLYQVKPVMTVLGVKLPG